MAFCAVKAASSARPAAVGGLVRWRVHRDVLTAAALALSSAGGCRKRGGGLG